MTVRLKQLELEALRLSMGADPAQVGTSNTPHSLSTNHFDISKHVALVPPFREAEVDSNLNAFEPIHRFKMAEGNVAVAIAM